MKHRLHACAFVTGLTTLSAQHCSQGTQVLILAGQAPVSGCLSPTPLEAAYENHSCKKIGFGIL